MIPMAKIKKNLLPGIFWVSVWCSFLANPIFNSQANASSNPEHSLYSARIAHSNSFKFLPSTPLSDRLNLLNNQKIILAGGHQSNAVPDPNQPEQNVSEGEQTTTDSLPPDPAVDPNQPEQNMSEGEQTTTESLPPDPAVDPNQPGQNVSEGEQTTTESLPPNPAGDPNQPEQNMSEGQQTTTESLPANPAGDPAETAEEIRLKQVRQSFNQAGKDYKSKNYRRAFDQFLKIATKEDFPQAQFNLAVMLKLGQGTLQDYGEAYKWCVLAELNGLKRAKKYQETLKELLTEKRHAELHKEVAKLLEQKIFSGSKKHIIQLSRWLMREPFDDKKNRDLAMIWALVGSALELDGATKIRKVLVEDLEIDELEKIQSKARKIFTEPKFQKLYGTL